MTDPLISEITSARQTVSAPTARPKSKRRGFAFLGLMVVGACVAIAFHFYVPGFRPLEKAETSHNTQVSVVPEESLNARVTDLEVEVGTLKDKIKTMQATPTPAPPAESKTDSSALDASSNAAELAKLQADFLSLSGAVNAQQALIKQAEAASSQSVAATETMLASAVDFMQLHDAAISGHGFAPELHALRSVAMNDAALQDQLGTLETYAAEGAPTALELREQLFELEAGAVHATQKAEAREWWERLMVEAKSLVNIRPLHGGGVGGDFQNVEEALERGDTKVALEAFQRLSPDAARYCADWHNKLEARDAIDRAMNAIAARFSTLTQSTSPSPGAP